MNSISETEVIQKIQSGDNTCFKELYDLYKNLVYSVCFRFLDDKSEVDDVSQDIFIKIFNNINSFRFDSKFSTWLYKLSVNHCLNILRSKKRIKWLSLEGFINKFNESNKIELEDESKDLNNNLIKKESSQVIQKAIDSLPENQKSAIILNKIEQLSYAEIAEIMECSISSVESLLFRAKKKLSKQLMKYFDK